MTEISKLVINSLKLPVNLVTRTQVVPKQPEQELGIDPQRPIFYVLKLTSASDLLAVAQACRKVNLPDPTQDIELESQAFPRTIYLEKRSPVWRKNTATSAKALGEALLHWHEKCPNLDAQLVPVTVFWGRDPGQEAEYLSRDENPGRLRKTVMLLANGRNCLVRFSPAVSLREMTDRYGADGVTAHKLLRVARFHFYRQHLAANGPKLWRKQQLVNGILGAKTVKKAIEDEAKSKGIPLSQAKQNAVALVNEIAADYSDSLIRFGERFLRWLWNKIYRGIKLQNIDRVRELAAQGHSIVYMPCHRSHMDYLLLSYVLYCEGLVPPHIAAGINLNFWPMGTIFRRGGAFFLRRSFKGNKLYSAVFREYLTQLFIKGHSVEFFTEGGRSRTGRLLPPKTGMLAMTMQSLLRGIDRPITIVPVYIGYEHVMEVGSYLKELKGKTKEKENALSILKATRKLSNYGFSYLSFGEPLTINQDLNQHAPDWKNYIDPLDAQRPQWLSPYTNGLADRVMTNINNAATPNGLTLTALCLLAADKQALTRSELTQQLAFYLALQQSAPYHPETHQPDADANTLLEHVLTLNKLKVSEDSFGEILSLDGPDAIAMTYYRNNILHCFMLPALIARVLINNPGISKQELMTQVSQLFPLLKAELYLHHSEDELEQHIEAQLRALAEHDCLTLADHSIALADSTHQAYFQLELLARCADEALQRYALTLHLLNKEEQVSRGELETKSQAMAQRLSAMHGINAPEFYDKKLFATLVSSMRDSQVVSQSEELLLCKGEGFTPLMHTLDKLISSNILQTIKNIS